MNILIVYATKHGCTENCVKSLMEKLSGEIDVCNIRKNNKVELSKYDKVIIGGSIYMGRIQKEISEFCSQNLSTLKQKKTGIFVCCMKEGEEARAQFNSLFPKELLENVITYQSFGGEFTFRKMNFLERFIVKKVSKTDKDTSSIQIKAIEDFALAINNA